MKRFLKEVLIDKNPIVQLGEFFAYLLIAGFIMQIVDHARDEHRKRHG